MAPAEPCHPRTGEPTTPFTALQLGTRVVAAPQAPPRRFVALAGGGPGAAPPPRQGRFTVLTYNLLADLYASPELYGSYCPPWALAWGYRRQNLLRELLGYGADILCLQEARRKSRESGKPKADREREWF